MSKILFITTDEQRFDALGCNGGTTAKTPRLDSLATSGLNYHRAYVNNVVCMPSRATMVTGQYPSTHGVIANGISLPLEAPCIADTFKNDAGFSTALIGKSHLQPIAGADADVPAPHNWERTAATRGDIGPYRGFDTVKLSSHGLGAIVNHYQVWLEENHPEYVDCYLRQVGPKGGLNLNPGGDTGAIQVHRNTIPTKYYHSYWLADEANKWIDERGDDEDWFLWVSFGDPHHPFQPPQEELARINWRDVPLPGGHPGTVNAVRAVLDQKPQHWMNYYLGTNYPALEIPRGFIPADMTLDQIREINTMVHIMNEVVDDAVGRILDHLDLLGFLDDTHIVFTSDHGSMQGDVGLMFKGPFHVDSLMHIPLIWRPAREVGIIPAQIDELVSTVDIAPTFCEMAGLPAADWMQGRHLPKSNDGSRDHVIVEWDQWSEDAHIIINTIITNDHICSEYLKSSYYDRGTGELYSYRDDQNQWCNLWDDLQHEQTKDELLRILNDSLPPRRKPPLPKYANA